MQQSRAPSPDAPQLTNVIASMYHVLPINLAPPNKAVYREHQVVVLLGKTIFIRTLLHHQKDLFEMAVAAYATLNSLSHVLDILQHPARLRRLHVDKNQIQSLQEKVQFLLDFLEAHSQRISEEIGGLGRQIADAAAEAEEVVDHHVVDQLRDGSQEGHCMAALSSFSQDIDKVIGKINSLTKELMMMVKGERADMQEGQRMVSMPVGSPEVLPSSGKKSTMVGFDEHLERIVDELTRGEPNLKILSIVGMGGSHESYRMHFLDGNKSWNLFCQKAFAQEGCPYPELEEIVENIVESCNGLPLVIVVVGGLLANSNRTREYWKFVAENINAFVIQKITRDV
ncbi:UNVERIFIED_CONTAM: hypothetical protein Scaly_1817200 [Sesamum calycinum]|uniref:NB-ARC domain-containing protein n=1 Tax=Sesamum calycinum TaxID=2727403 RepID=A0AAW2NGD0_9LAMI